MGEADEVMELDSGLLLRLLLTSFWFGVISGALYDVVRLQRVLLGMNRYTLAAERPAFCPHFVKVHSGSIHRGKGFLKRIVLAIQDVVFCVTVSILVAILLFSQNNGEFRGFVLIGLGIGFAAYYFTVGKLVITASEYIVFALKTAVLYIVYYITYPFFAAARFLIAQGGKLCSVIRERKIVQYDKMQSAFLLSEARRGFLPTHLQENEKRR